MTSRDSTSTFLLSSSWRTHSARKFFQQRLKSLRGGVHLELLEGSTTSAFGDMDGSLPEFSCAASRPQLSAQLHIRDASFYSDVLVKGEIGAADAYIDGKWDTSDLPTLLRIFVRNTQSSQSSGLLGWIQSAWQAFQHRLRANTKSGSAKNIAAHYDLSNQFFQLFLDETLNYSSAIFGRDDWELREASEFKMSRICRKLGLRDHDHVLEIGTGWGGLALHLASHSACRITTTTISSQQYTEAERRFREAELNDRIQLLKLDYRELRGTFDKLVSIEMIEAVGDEYLDEFFAQCGRLLHSEGRMVLQAIVMDDRKYARYVRGSDYIRHAIFPGGCLPSLARMQAAVASRTDLRLLHLEDLTSHYARTLAMWRMNFLSRRRDVLALGFDDRFIRMWDFYLSYCQASFEERYIQSMQLVWGKPDCDWDPVRSLSAIEQVRSHQYEHPSTQVAHARHAPVSEEVV